MSEQRWIYTCYLLTIVLVGILLLYPKPAVAESASQEGRWHTFTFNNGLAGSIVQAMWEDSQGRIWFGTENGVSRYDGRTWETYRTVDGLVDNNVWSISGDTDVVWFATSNGLSKFQAGKWINYTTEDGLPSNDVRAVLVSREGTVWAGTFGGGIGRKLPGAQRWESFDISSKVPNRDIIVQAIWQSPTGQLWFGTNGHGVLRLDSRGLEKFSFKQTSYNTVWSIGGVLGEHATWLATFRGIVKIEDNE